MTVFLELPCLVICTYTHKRTEVREARARTKTRTAHCAGTTKKRSTNAMTAISHVPSGHTSLCRNQREMQWKWNACCKGRSVSTLAERKQNRTYIASTPRYCTFFACFTNLICLAINTFEMCVKQKLRTKDHGIKYLQSSWILSLQIAQFSIAISTVNYSKL